MNNFHFPKSKDDYELQTIGCGSSDDDGYFTLHDAVSACDSDSACWGVYDSGCDGEHVSICPFGANTFDQTSSNPCSYFKIGKYSANS